jgi:EmrB/QacA subfamily drug resistance transporter
MAQKWWVLASVACGTFMATLDSSIVNIALPTLTKELSSDISQIKWVVVIYLLVITWLLLPLGRLSDQYGRKRIFQLGFIVFTLGSGLCGLSPNLGALLATRAIQAIGAAMLMANGPAIITAAFPAGERGKALGIMAMVVSAGLVSGPSVGGFLISSLGWRSIFLVNLPVGLTGIVLVQRSVHPDRLPKSPVPFDWAGAFLQMFLLTSVMVLVDPPEVTFSGGVPFPAPRVVLAALIIVFLSLFIKVESDARAPLFDLSLLKNRTFWTANLASFLTFVAYSSLTLLMPFFLEEVMHYAPNKAGIFMTAIPLTVFVVAPISGRLSDRLGSKELSVAGALIGSACLFLLAGTMGFGIDENVSRLGIILALCSMGLATGLFQSPNNNAIMSAVPYTKLGVASAMLATVRNLGLTIGTGLATGLFAWRRDQTGDFVEALHFTFFIAGLIAVGAMLAALAKRGGRDHLPPSHTHMPTS